jgi:hypothetical protein
LKNSQPEFSGDRATELDHAHVDASLYAPDKRFSQKIENMQAAVSLHLAHYNLVRLHKSLRTTPAMAAGMTDRLWSLEELVERVSK